MADLLLLLIFIFPAYVANAVPVVLGGGTYLDLEKNFSDGRRIFGDGKTIRGFVAGVTSGAVMGGILAIALPLSFYSSPQSQFIGSFMLSLGTMVGDALGSFIKRRMNVAPGKPFLLDQLSFLIFALIFVYPFVNSSVFSLYNIVFLFIMTYILHIGMNVIANKAGLKKVPW
ncbi:CDP-2,3-bis-(O-geranylgeranyl)-sn-glycerol synthase [Candidatus Micrarchaeota archaeon]|nr:CDP-2,3-bis-(O-geranylgeranyl)-sn-glycerol synthase [Candidatus Micrarchaeota archaeon]